MSTTSRTLFAGLVLGFSTFTVPALAQPASPEAIATADRLSEAFNAVAEHVRPSVVSIAAVQTVKQASQQNVPQMFNDPFFRHFFGDQLPEQFGNGDQQQPQEFKREGEGTGFIISHDGYIITNNHVVQDASELTVVLNDERRFEATVVGTDPQTDVAVVKIQADGLPYLEMADSDQLKVGQWVVAVGSPFGLSSSITAGIVSATGRSQFGLADYEDFIQTDAAINPGNSGGPLVNLHGQVVGMNTAIFTRSGGYMGIGFAIPSNLVDHISNELITDGSVHRGWLGVYIQDLNEGLAKSFNFEGTDGVLVSSVVEDGPAAKAGLKDGDIITAIDGEPVKHMGELRLKVAHTEPGTKLTFDLVRDGRKLSKIVEIEKLASEEAPSSETSPAQNDLDMQLQSLTPDVAERLNLDADSKGVLVADIEQFGTAWNAGLRQGDVIVKVGDDKVTDERDFNKAIASHDLKDGVRLTVMTNGAQRFVWLQTD